MTAPDPASRLLPADDPRLASSRRIGDVWAAVAPLDDPELRGSRWRIRALLADRPEPLARHERPGHVTGSALVIDHRCERTLLMLHAKLAMWVQPGGHADGDANLAAVALREAAEETGIEGLRVWPTAIDLDVHEVRPPAEGAHLHFDVRFLVMAPEDASPTGNHESRELRWVTAPDLGALGADAGVRRLARRGFALARDLLTRSGS
ncbi:MAG: NUDIX hydrolase [Acidimicrobiales bacterium]